MTLILQQGRRCLAWDATLVDTFATSCLPASSKGDGNAAKAVEERRTAKYSALSSSHIFIHVTIETLDSINEVGEEFLAQVGKLLSTKSDDPRERFILFQRISVIIQRFIEISFWGTFTEEPYHDE